MYSSFSKKICVFCTAGLVFLSACTSNKIAGFASSDAPGGDSGLDASGQRQLPFTKIPTRKADLMDETPLSVSPASEQEAPSIERQFALPDRVSSKDGETFGVSEYPDYLYSGRAGPGDRIGSRLYLQWRFH